MIDYDDVGVWALFGPVFGPISAIIFVIILLALSYQACENEKDCVNRHCDTGKPTLLNHSCVCMSGAK